MAKIGIKVNNPLSDITDDLRPGLDWAKERLAPSQKGKGAKEADQRARDQQTANYEWNKQNNTQYDTAESDYDRAQTRAEDAYSSGIHGAVNPQLDTLGRLQQESQSQANDARTTYEGTIKPGNLELMNQAMGNARSAMSLDDYMNPDNKVSRATRDLYDQQAQGVGKQGLADAGILMGMGAQATGQAFGTGGPMSTGQLQSLYAANQAQSGKAYANTQKQMSDLKQQGLTQGLLQSDKAYQAGERAQGRASDTIRNVADAEGQYINKASGLRGEQAGIGSDIMGLNLGVNQADYGISSGRNERGLGLNTNRLDRNASLENVRSGVLTQDQANQAALARAGLQSNERMKGALIQAGATGAGAYLGSAGGPAGAQQGAQAGSLIGGAAANGYQEDPYAPKKP
jgi:hypothetical protein